jgi:hypothetical protein
MTVVRANRRYRWPVDRARILHRHRSVLGWLVAAGVMIGGATVRANPPDDVLPDDIGPGWEQATGDFCELGAPWVVRCFSGPSGYVLVSATPVEMYPHFEAQFLATGFNTDAELSPDLTEAWWLPPEASDAPHAYVIGSERFVYLIMLFPFERASASDDALLLSVARDLHARGGGPPRSQAERDVPQELAAVLVAEPPSGFRASPALLIVEDADGYQPPMSARLGSCSSGRAGPSCAHSPTAPSTSW